jgi:hypothetical protein
MRGRLMAGLAAATLSWGVLAAIPAQAAAESADLSVQVLSSKASTGDGGFSNKAIVVEVRNNSTTVTATNVRVTLDLSDAEALVSLDAFNECVPNAAQTVATCTFASLPPLAARSTADQSLGALVQVSGELGQTATVRVAVTADTADPDQGNNEVTGTIEVTGPGTDLVAAGAFLDVLTPGDTRPVPMAIAASQVGSVLADSAVAHIELPALLTFVPGTAGCEFAADRRADTALGNGSVTLTLPGGAADVDPGDNVLTFGVRTTPLAADLAMVGINPAGDRSTDLTLKGKVGQTLPVLLFPFNNGPGSSVGGLTLDLTAPAGTAWTAITLPGGRCTIARGGHTAHCVITATFTIAPDGLATAKLRLLAAPGGKDGRIVVGGPLADPDPGNNTQKLAVSITGSVPTTPAPTHSAPAGASGGGAGSTPGASLPATGVGHPGSTALAGLGVLLLGAALTAAARRRRITA